MRHLARFKPPASERLDRRQSYSVSRWDRVAGSAALQSRSWGVAIRGRAALESRAPSTPSPEAETIVIQRLVRPEEDHLPLASPRRHLAAAEPRDLRPRQRRHDPALRPGAPHRRPGPAVPLSRVRQRLRRSPDRDPGRPARQRRS